MKVKMLVSTTFRGRFLKNGDEVVIDNESGKRFINNKIAIQLEEEKPEVVEDNELEDIEEVDINSLSNKELFNLCKEKEIELDKNEINGKSAKEKKEYLLSVLSGK